MRRGNNEQTSKTTQRSAHADAKAGRWSRLPVATAMALAILLILAIYFTNRARHSTEPSRTQLQSSLSPPVQITKPLDVSAVDIEKQQWPTEILNEKIDSQLKALAKQLSDSDNQIKAGNIRSIVSEDVVAIDLNPQRIAACFDDGDMRVERVSPDAAERLPVTLMGIERLADGLSTMMRPFESITNVQVKFKVIQIAIAEESASTAIRVSLDGQSSDHQWQQNAIWHCDWTTKSNEPSISRLEGDASAFERVIYSSDNRLFSDQTAMAIGNNECFGNQMRQDVNYWLSRLESAHGIELLGAHGVSIVDINGDGLDDIYACQPGGLPNRLFVAGTNGVCVEQAAKFGLDILDATRSALFVDLDNDGDQDAALVVADHVVVFENSATGQFLLRQQFPIPINPTAILAADFDSDRLLDLYVLNHDSNGSVSENGILGTPIPFHDANNGGANVLLRNLANFSFEDVTSKTGLDSNNLRFSLAGSWDDYDDDGDMDLYVANDFGRNNLYRNDHGRFVDAAGDLGVEDLSAGMSVSWGDVNNDGRQDIYVSNMFSSAGNRIAYQRNFHLAETPETRSRFQRHARGNSLFLQVDNGRFQDISQSSNVTMGRWAWASKFADINNDGLQDILITNGFITNEDTNDL